MGFAYDLTNVVTIVCSGEIGTIIARAEYLDEQSHYLLRYQDANGVARESWWRETALTGPDESEVIKKTNETTS